MALPDGLAIGDIVDFKHPDGVVVPAMVTKIDRVEGDVDLVAFGRPFGTGENGVGSSYYPNVLYGTARGEFYIAGPMIEIDGDGVEPFVVELSLGGGGSLEVIQFIYVDGPKPLTVEFSIPGGGSLEVEEL